MGGTTGPWPISPGPARFTLHPHLRWIYRSCALNLSLKYHQVAVAGPHSKDHGGIWRAAKEDGEDEHHSIAGEAN